MGRGIVPNDLHPSTESGVLSTQPDSTLVEKPHRRAVTECCKCSCSYVLHTDVYCYAHSPLCGTGAPEGDALWLTERCSGALSRSVSAVSFGTACFSLLGIVNRNGMNSAAQADFGSYSDNFVSLFVVLGMVVPSGLTWTAYL